MTEPGRNGKSLPLSIAWLTAGLVVLVLGWLIPVNLKSLTPAVLAQAGEGTPSLAKFGKQLLDSEKLGPAQLVLNAARLVGDSDAGMLDRGIRDVATRRPEWVAWGGWDPFLDPLFNLKENTGKGESTPVLNFLITEKARKSLRTYLSNSRSLGVQAMLATREINGTTQFIPATHAGGQALDSVILLTALLYQGEHLSGQLQRELRGLAEDAVQSKKMGELEMFYIDLLSLGKRLNWIQLCELLRITDSAKTVGEYAHLARVAPDNLPLIYSAALFSDSADRVASYLIHYGKNGLEDLRHALSHGQGAVRLLLLHQVPINRSSGPALGFAARIAFLHPRLALLGKYLAFLLGAFCVFRGLETGFAPPTTIEAPARMTSSVLAVLAAGILVLATEPFLLKAAPPSEFRLRLTIPALANLTDVKPPTTPASAPAMETSTLLSIAIFATFQVIMYLVCLVKIREISRQVVPPLVKLRLMENEENLFDGGLYIGIAGTASALVLQVLGVIQPNLLAAYSSNLFGIICVALVKIRHVRAFKRQLILESQSAAVIAGAPVVAPTKVSPASPVARPSSAS
ncbi:hypothetical protein DB347_01645 [Opitutaceae bacterium EW11]|nr:hypothetical protein DB347_01645 [Opitutaceae bacterium EW11]